MEASDRDAPRELRTFLDRLRRAGELVEIGAEVDADLEVAEIHRRVIAAEGPALLFRRVKGAAFPLVTNLFGNARRVDLAFGSRPREVVAEIARLPLELVPPTLGKLWGKRRLFSELAKVGLRDVRRAPVAQVVRERPDLRVLPALRSWARDGGPFLTLPLVHTVHPEHGTPNLGMYRAQLFGGNQLGMHVQIQRGAGNHLFAAEELGQALPLNLYLGGPPALILAAIAPLPENVPELLLASLAQGARLATARHPASPIPLVAEAEMCLVGRIQPGARRPEGPFGDHYGFYSEVHDFPWLEIDALLHRKDAIFPATVVGKPRQEDFFLGDYLQELLSPLFPLVMPGVRDLWSYGETGYHSLSAAVVHERYEREAMVSAFRILGEGQLSLTKFLLVTDAPVDLRDFRATLTAVLERSDVRTDLFVFPNLSMDTLDYAGPRLNRGSKGVLLGVGPKRRSLPDRFEGPLDAPAREPRVFSPGCLVVGGPSHAEDPGAAARIAASPALAPWPLVVLCDDPARAAKSPINLLWSTFTRFDPAADLHAARVEVHQGHLVRQPPIVIDARTKAGYPEELFCDPDTARRVERRWKEYFPAGQVEMGDSDRGHLD